MVFIRDELIGMNGDCVGRLVVGRNVGRDVVGFDAVRISKISSSAMGASFSILKSKDRMLGTRRSCRYLRLVLIVIEDDWIVVHGYVLWSGWCSNFECVLWVSVFLVT